MNTRAYAPGDREACLAIFDSNVPEDFRAEEREGFEGFLDALPGPYFVGVDGAGRVLACGGYALEPDGETASMCWGMVDRATQGEGLGRRLLEERVERAARDRRVRRIRLGTSQRTQGFFEKLGFAVVEVTSDGIAPGLDAVEMVRELA